MLGSSRLYSSSLIGLWSGEFYFDMSAFNVERLRSNRFLGSIGSILKRNKAESSGSVGDLVDHDNAIGNGPEFFEDLLQSLLVHGWRYSADKDFVVYLFGGLTLVGLLCWLSGRSGSV